MLKVVYWIVGLIALYIIATKWLGFTNVISTLGKSGAQGVAVLQGREVKGVTN